MEVSDQCIIIVTHQYGISTTSELIEISMIRMDSLSTNSMVTNYFTETLMYKETGKTHGMWRPMKLYTQRPLDN
jgi:hypothetical protein